MDIHVQDLTIEVTRRCNMHCEHCLRGDAQNCNMNIRYVEALFSKVKYISTLTLTGGEPSLATNVIEKIIDCAHVYNVEIGNFYIATNGKRITPKFVRVVERLYCFCNENEMSCVHISNDEFHHYEGGHEETNGFYQLMNLPYASMKWEQDKSGYLPDRNIVNDVYYYQGALVDEGRTNENGLAYRGRIVTPDKFMLDNFDTSFGICDGVLYLNCKGWLIAGCDFSFDRQDDPEFDGRICHVNDFSIAKMKEFCRKDEANETDLMEQYEALPA